jgi:hypothetical protein
MVGFPKVFQVHMAVLKLQIQETKTISHNKTRSYNKLKLIIFKKLWQKLVGFLRTFQACMVVLNSKSNIQKNPTINKNFTTLEKHNLEMFSNILNAPLVVLGIIIVPQHFYCLKKNFDSNVA